MRRKILRITPILLVDALKNPNPREGCRLRSEGVPADMRIVGCHWDSMSGDMVLLVESEEFDIQDCGSTLPLPELRILFHQESVDQPQPEPRSALMLLQKAHPGFLEGLGFTYSEE